MFDSHAHYDDERFDKDRDEVLRGLFGEGVTGVVNVGSDIESSKACLELAGRYNGFLWASAGIHPHCAKDAPIEFEKPLTVLLRNENSVAVGEIGLDYHYDYSQRDVQREVLSRQLVLAGQLGLPVIIHDREAHDDVADIARAHSADFRGGVFHCFSGDEAFARRVIKMGYYIAFGGSVTFKHAESEGLLDALAYVPNDRLLIETDSPYLTPVPHRGKRNDSSMLRLIAEKVALVRKIDTDEVLFVTCQNAKKLFGISY